MKKAAVTYQSEMADLKRRIDNLESKLTLTSEPLLVDALAYELLSLRARMDFLIVRAKQGRGDT